MSSEQLTEMENVLFVQPKDLVSAFCRAFCCLPWGSHHRCSTLTVPWSGLLKLGIRPPSATEAAMNFRRSLRIT